MRSITHISQLSHVLVLKELVQDSMDMNLVLLQSLGKNEDIIHEHKDIQKIP